MKGMQVKQGMAGQVKEFLVEIVSAKWFQLLVIALGFTFQVWYRLYIKSFGVSLGYFTVLLISLGGFWFGLRGGFLIGALAILEYITELYFLSQYANLEVILRGIQYRFATYLLSGMFLGWLSDQQRRMREQLKVLAHYDELTGCVNYRLTMQFLEREVSRAIRLQKPLSIVMVDLDYFKEINDTYGHLVGNEVLSSFAAALQKSLRTVDVVGRYGGDEFLLLFPDTNPQQARVVMQRIKDKLQEIKVSTSFLRGKEKEGVTPKFSAGIASLPYNAESLMNLMRVADSALYEAKREGRDTIFVERRRWFRCNSSRQFRVELLSEPADKEGFKEVMVKNISPRGMLCVTRGLLPESLVCRVWFDDKKVVSECKAKLIHRKKLNDNETVFGIFLPMIPVTAKDALERILFGESRRTAEK